MLRIRHFHSIQQAASSKGYKHGINIISKLETGRKHCGEMNK
jgi:hypothetical protein